MRSSTDQPSHGYDTPLPQDQCPSLSAPDSDRSLRPTQPTVVRATQIAAGVLSWVSRTLLYLCHNRDCSVTHLLMNKLYLFNHSYSQTSPTKHVGFSHSEGTDVDKQLLLNTWISGVLLQSSKCYCSFSCVLNYGMLFVCVCLCRCMCEQARYKSKAKDLLKSGCNELLRPDILTALYSTVMGSKVNSHRVVCHCNSDPCPQTSRR